MIVFFGLIFASRRHCLPEGSTKPPPKHRRPERIHQAETIKPAEKIHQAETLPESVPKQTDPPNAASIDRLKPRQNAARQAEPESIQQTGTEPRRADPAKAKQTKPETVTPSKQRRRADNAQDTQHTQSKTQAGKTARRDTQRKPPRILPY